MYASAHRGSISLRRKRNLSKMMSNFSSKMSLAFALLLPAVGYAQGAPSGGDLTQIFLLGVVLLLVLVVIWMVASSFLNLEARALGANKGGNNFGILPSADEILPSDKPEGVESNHVINLKQGFDLKLMGEPLAEMEEKTVSSFAVQPPNFIGMSPLPKLNVEVGQSVQAGDELFFDKKRPEIKYVAPVSGEIAAITRGDKRAIMEVVILADREQRYRVHSNVPSLSADRSEIIAFMMEAGVWPMLRQRPFNIVPDPEDVPKGIFISTFDTAPQAPDLNLAVQGRELAFQRGLDVLKTLTPGAVYLGLDGRKGKSPSHVFSSAAGVEKFYFRGAHPAGNVGVQIHHIDPVDASQVVWTAGVQEVISIGELFLSGRYDASRVVALSGDMFVRPRHVRTWQGASLNELIKGELIETDKQIRLISGDVLSGSQKQPEGYLDFYDDQLTSIEEGNYYELFGWLVPIDPRPSRSNTFPNKLFGADYAFKPTTNSHGEQRAFVVTGEYEAVLPMDVLPQHLMKAIMANDFERMEGLGLYELVEEDIAICEFACTSKQPLQRILRQGLETMRAQG